MINCVLCVMIITVLLLGLLVKNILGFSFLLVAILWLVGLLVFIDNLFIGNSSHKIYADIFLKTTYLVLTFFILYFRYRSISMLSTLAIYVLLLAIDMVIIKVPYHLVNDANKSKEESIKSQKTINIQYTYYLFGNKDAIFGDGNQQHYIKSLALVTYSALAVIIFTMLSIFLDKIYNYKQSLNVTPPIIIMCALLYYLFYNLIKHLDVSRTCKMTVLLFAITMPTIFSLPSVFVNKVEMFKGLGINLYTNIIGIGISSSLLLFCIKSSKWLNFKISNLNSKGD